MKLCGHEMKVTLSVFGKERTFSEKELIAILEKHFSNEATKYPPKFYTEDQWFEVDPLGIDQKLFQSKKTSTKQENIRQLILDSFTELNNNPEKYGKKFKTMMPMEDLTSKTISELKEIAYKVGDHMANWVEQGLEWAQRIANGESWDDVCNVDYSTKLYRAVSWKNGDTRIMGNLNFSFKQPGTIVYCDDYDTCSRTVPLVVKYEK